jgi:hypothetical protein
MPRWLLPGRPDSSATSGRDVLRSGSILPSGLQMSVRWARLRADRCGGLREGPILPARQQMHCRGIVRAARQCGLR